MNVSFWAV